MKSLGYIDSLRGFAILGVILVHTKLYDTINYPDLFNSVVNEGARGVQLFFLCSAFTLFYSFRFKNGSELTTSSFFIRRFFRVAPMYYLAIAIYTIFRLFSLDTGITPMNTDLSSSIILNTFFLHGFHPTYINSFVPGGWSIAVEMTFYLSLPVLFKLIKSTNKAILFFFVSLFLYLALNKIIPKSIGGTSGELDEFLFLYLPSQLPLFALGILGYFVIIEKDRNINPLLILLGLITALVYNFLNLTFPNHILYGLYFFVFMIVLSQRTFTLFVNKITIFIGKVSYSAYFIHFIVLLSFSKLGILNLIEPSNELNAMINFFLRFLFVTTITITLSFFTYNLVEVKFQKLGQKLISKLGS